jgi:hypothetical protein
MRLVGFQPMTPVFYRALDLEATMINSYGLSHINILLILRETGMTQLPNPRIREVPKFARTYNLFLRYMFSNSSQLHSNHIHSSVTTFRDNKKRVSCATHCTK